MYLVNRPLLVAGIPEDNARSWEIVLFSDKCEILRTIFQPRALSSNIPASQKGFIYSIILCLIFNMLGDQRKLWLVQNFSVTGLHKTSLFLWYLLLLPFEIMKKIKTEKRLILLILSCFCATEKLQGKYWCEWCVLPDTRNVTQNSQINHVKINQWIISQCTLHAPTVIPGFRLYRCSSDIHACILIVLILIFLVNVK